MRQRKLKDLDTKMEPYRGLLADDPAALRGHWRSLFGRNQGTLYAEIGCGKGRFITDSAASSPEAMFIGFEGQESIIYRALQKSDASAGGFDNVRFCAYHIDDPRTYFDSGELDGIFLNFSDPWPKEKHAKRRLTTEEKLSGYLEILSEGGFLRVKTDNSGLFGFTLDGLARTSGFEVVRVEDDIWHSDLAESNIMTEYEHKFLNLKRKIHYLEAVKK